MTKELQEKAKRILRKYPPGSRLISEGDLLIAVVPLNKRTVCITVYDRTKWEMITTEVVGCADNLHESEERSAS